MSTAVRAVALPSRSRTMARASKTCKDCGVGSKRPAPHPGPRCATHHRAVKAARKAAAHSAWVLKTYGLKEGQYEALYEAQGGSCWLCKRAKGISRKLSVDHDHATGYVRGLLCSTCNKILGHLRDDPDFAYRIADYIVDPPAFKTIGQVKANE